MLRDLLMIVFVTVTTLGGQLLIKDAVMRIGERTPALHGLDWVLAVLAAPKIWWSILVQAIGFLVWVAVVSRMNLGPAYAAFGAFFYTLLALASWWLYGERLAPLHWAGIVLVSVGVVILSLPATKG